MIVDQKPKFHKTYKKLKIKQLADVNTAIQKICAQPDIGILKTADLNGMRIYKFKMNKQPVLLAYDWNKTGNAVTLLALGSHENFYRGLKV